MPRRLCSCSSQILICLEISPLFRRLNAIAHHKGGLGHQAIMRQAPSEAAWISERMTRGLTVALLVIAVLPPLGLMLTRADHLPLDGMELDALPLKTSAASRLLFQNVRSGAYDRRHDPKSRADHYTLEQSDDPATLRWTIVNWWMADTAVISPTIQGSTLRPKRIQCALAEERQDFPWAVATPTEAATTAARLYRCLARDGQGWLVGDDLRLQLWKTPEQRRQAKRVFRDYFALIEAI